jgi:hypothetical protein
LLRKWIEIWKKSRVSFFDIDDTSFHVQRNSFWSWKKFFKMNDLNWYKNDDTRNNNTHTNEKSKQFKNEQSIIKKKRIFNNCHHRIFRELERRSYSRFQRAAFISCSTLCLLSHCSNLSKKAYVYVYLLSRFFIVVYAWY